MLPFKRIVHTTLLHLHIHRLVMSFEAIGLNLVTRSDFVSLDVVKEDISMKAGRVSW